jgi:hypothetical protein
VRTYHLLIDGESPRRNIAFAAESPDHALHVAEREAEGISAELWDGDTLLARMTKAGPGLWQLHPCQRASDRQARPMPQAHRTR